MTKYWCFGCTNRCELEESFVNMLLQADGHIYGVMCPISGSGVSM